MNINATLIGQSVAFIIFMWFCMKYVWPPVVRTLEFRKQKIADGLASAEKAEIQLSQAKVDAEKKLQNASEEARMILNKANNNASKIIEKAKEQARLESEKIKLLAQKEMEQEIIKAETALRKKVAGLAIASAEKIVQEQMDEATNKRFMEKLLAHL